MKLSDIKGPRAVDVIAELIQPLANIAGDRENIGHLFSHEIVEGKTEAESTAERLKENVPLLLKTHNADILAILSVINDEDPESISVPKIITGILDLIGDEDFMALFMSAVPKEARQQPTGSSKTAGTSKPE